VRKKHQRSPFERGQKPNRDGGNNVKHSLRIKNINQTIADLTAGVHCPPARTDPSTAPSFSKPLKMDWKNEPSTETPLAPCIS
jgi:hypothetical protein